MSVVCGYLGPGDTCTFPAGHNGAHSWDTPTPSARSAGSEGAEAPDLWRELAWLHHGHDGLYGDDGEMQCNQYPPADFVRDNDEQIERHLSHARLTALRAAPPSAPDPEGLPSVLREATTRIIDAWDEWQPGSSRADDQVESLQGAVESARAILARLSPVEPTDKGEPE